MQVVRGLDTGRELVEASPLRDDRRSDGGNPVLIGDENGGNGDGQRTQRRCRAATLAYLSESGISPTVSSLRCGHSYHTKSGNVSEHAFGNAVDISRVNGIPVLGHQEPGGITDQTVRRIMQLQGGFAPHQLISLLQIGGPTLAMADHADHIHVGFSPARVGATGRSAPVLKPYQWPLLMERLREMRNPRVGTEPGGR